MESEKLESLFSHHLCQSYHRSFSTHDIPSQYIHLRDCLLSLRMLFGYAYQRNLYIVKKEGSGWQDYHKPYILDS